MKFPSKMAHKKKKGGFFSDLGSAMDNMASSIDNMASTIDKAAKTVSSGVVKVILNPMDHVKPGNVLAVISRANLKSVVVDSNGMVYCNGNPTQLNHTGAQFEVVASQYSNKTYKLRNVAYPQFHLAVVNGYFIGNGQGGPECDFYVHHVPASSTEYVVFESAMSPGSHIGVLPTGQFTAPAQTSPQSGNAAHFMLKYITYHQPALPPPQTALSQPPPPPPPQGQEDPPPQRTPPPQGVLPPPQQSKGPYPEFQQGYTPDTGPSQHMYLSPSAPPK